MSHSNQPAPIRRHLWCPSTWTLLLALFAWQSVCAGDIWYIQVGTTVNAEDNQEIAPIRIDKVEDARQFIQSERLTPEPSLKNGRIDDPTETRVAVGRTISRFGAGRMDENGTIFIAAGGNVYLDEDQTVSKVVRTAVSRALRLRNYIILRKEEAQAKPAPTLQVEIRKFWCRPTLGQMGVINLVFNAELHITGEMLPAEGIDVAIEHSRGSMKAGKDAYKTVIDEGLDLLVRKTAEQFPAAQASTANP